MSYKRLLTDQYSLKKPKRSSREQNVVNQEKHLTQMPPPVAKMEHDPQSRKQAEAAPAESSTSIVNGMDDKPTLNEILKKEDAPLAETAVKTKISNLKTAIDINQKFSFINELFNGDVDAFTQALNQLNSFDNHQAAKEYLTVDLKAKYNWTDDVKSLTELSEFVERRYL